MSRSNVSFKIMKKKELIRSTLKVIQLVKQPLKKGEKIQIT